MRHFEIEISQYIDGELPSEECSELFNHLGTCAECRNEMLVLNKVKENSKNHFIKMISGTETKIDVWRSIYKIGFYVTAAATIVLLIHALTHKAEPIYLTQQKIKNDTVYVTRERVIYSTVKNTIVKTNKEQKPANNDENYLKYVMSLRSEKFSKADIL